MQAMVADVLLYHFRLIGIVVVVIGAVISVLIYSIMVFTPPAIDTQLSSLPREPKLQVDILDTMEVIIEDRNSALENPPDVPARYFGL